MSMRRSSRLIVLVAGVTAALTAALAVIADAASGPTGAQIRAAVRRAEKSTDLWATINVCNVPAAKPSGDKQIGVRVQIPALGFNARLYMTLGLQFWEGPRKGYVNTNVHGPETIGLAVHSPRQGGYSFYYPKPPAGQTYLVRGSATLEWRISKTVLGRITRPTGGGYKHVDFGNPRGLSIATCTLTP